MVRRLLVLALVAAGLVLAGSGEQPVRAAVPVAADDNTYLAMGRVFPDPHGCIRGAPAASPWAKGRVCAVQFVQWDEALSGLRYLEKRFPRFVELVDLHAARQADPALAGEDMLTAGLPQSDLSRNRVPLYALRITDEASPVPEAERRRFVYSLSIHGIERAGLEGGIRAAEDLVTWAATEPGKRILEPTGSGPAAGEVLERSVVTFLLSNPDGWRRGDVTRGGAFYQRYNGNGVDLNRDWPALGYVERAYTPHSEPESRGFGTFLKEDARRASSGRYTGGIDLHGMLAARSLSYTMLNSAPRDWAENQRAVDVAVRTFRDAEKRLTWSPHVAPADRCPGESVTVPLVSEVTAPMCTDQWGTVWDTIDYDTTGSFADWMESDLGVGALALTNEMAYSHLTPNNVYDPGIEQLHIDGNKGLIYSQLASLLDDAPTVPLSPGGRVAYVPAANRIRSDGGAPAGAANELPAQDPIELTELAGRGVEFTVKGSGDGVANGSMSVEATYTNVGGISPDAFDTMVVERFASDHAGDPARWLEVGRHYNQSGVYLQSGARVDVTGPLPGRYRVRPSEDRSGVTRFRVRFDADRSPVPDQSPYDVANTDVVRELNRFTSPGQRLTELRASEILRRPRSLEGVDTLVLADDAAPGVPAAERPRWTQALRDFVTGGGNLVLTDGAMTALADLGLVPENAVRRGFFYAGWIDFDDGKGATYARHPLAADVQKEGAAEGQATVHGSFYQHRHQTYAAGPLGFYVSATGSSNASCSFDRCDSPVWVVDPKAWTAAGGTVAGRSVGNRTTTPATAPEFGVALGEVKLGAGQVRVAGALLPTPSQANYHPYGLAGQALTYTGYEVLENLLQHRRAVVAASRSELPATGDGRPGASLAAGLALVVLAISVRRSGARPARGRRRPSSAPAPGS
jgi:hypothetical protein